MKEQHEDTGVIGPTPIHVRPEHAPRWRVFHVEVKPSFTSTEVTDAD